MRHVIVFALVLIALLLWFGGRGRPASSAGLESSPKEMAPQVELLKGLVPDQAHIMADVGYHFGNLWFAGRAENWPLAEFYHNETKSHLRWAVRAKPIRQDNQGRDVNLTNILEAFENSQLAHLKRAIDGKDRAAFERVYRESLTACYSCHKASDKPYLRPQVPTVPEARMINFDPKADWPL